MTFEETTLAKEIETQYSLSKRFLDPIHAKMNDQESLYRSYLDNSYPHNARVFDPRVFRIIETVAPRMVANEPTGSFYPREGGDVVTTEILNAMTKYDWKRADMFTKLVRFVKSMLIFGTGFGRTYWDFREVEKEQMVPMDVNGTMAWSPKNTEKIKIKEFDGPNFEPLNIYDCFPDPNATSMDDIRWFIYRSFRTLDELEAENETRGTEYYKNLGELKERVAKAKKEGGNIPSSHPEDISYREHRRTMLSSEELRGEDESNPEFVILRRFSKDRWVDYIPDHNIIIRDISNPYFHGHIPIICGVDYIYPGELYGMGEIEPIDRIQRAINAVLNQRLDNVQLVLRNMWKVKKNGGVDLHTLISSPGNIVTTEDMNAVEMLNVPDVTGGTFVETMNYLTSALQNGSGVTDYTIGLGNDSNVANKTATGTRLIQQEANAQFKLKIQLFNHMVVEKIADQWKDMRIQYTTESEKLRIVGRQAIKSMLDKTNLNVVDINRQEVAPGDLETPTKLQVADDEGFAFLNLLPEDMQPAIVGNYDFIAATTSDQLSDPVAMTENFFTALDRVSNPLWTQGLQLQGKQLNYVDMTEKVFEKLELGIEANKVLTDVQPPMQPTPMGMAPAGAMQEQAPQGNMFQNLIQKIGGNRAA